MRQWIAGAALAASLSASAQVPNRIGYQGRMLKSDGTPEAGVQQITFTVWTAATGGTALACDAPQVAFNDGYYSVALGDVGGCAGGLSGLQSSTFDGRDLWLEVGIAGVAMAPRQRIGTVPYAHRSGTAVNVRGGTVEATTVSVGGTTGVSITGAGISLGGTPMVDSFGNATVAAGAGLTGNGTAATPLAVAFQGSGSQASAARSDHAHGPNIRADADGSGYAFSADYTVPGVGVRRTLFEGVQKGVGPTFQLDVRPTGAIEMTGIDNIITRTLESTVATGTSPLVVASRTAVANLNSDLLDGQDSTAFARKRAMLYRHPTAGLTLTGGVQKMTNFSDMTFTSSGGPLLFQVSLQVNDDRCLGTGERIAFGCAVNLDGTRHLLGMQEYTGWCDFEWAYSYSSVIPAAAGSHVAFLECDCRFNVQGALCNVSNRGWESPMGFPGTPNQDTFLLVELDN